MASRVNVKFVVILSAGLVLVAAAAATLAMMVLLKSADDLAQRGDSMMAAGDYKAAEVFYSKAVNKEPYNSAYLLKWRDALHQWVPETDREFQTEFRSTYMPLHKQLALSDNMSHIEHQVAHIRLLAKYMELAGFDRAAYDNLIAECDRFITTLETTRPGDPAWVPLRRARGLAWARIAAEKLELTPEQLATAEADLGATLQADPSDIDALEALVSLRRTTADRAREMGRRGEANDLEQSANQLISDFVATNGPDTLAGAQGRMLQTQASLTEQRAAASAELGAGALPEIKRIATEHHAQTREIAATLLAVDPAKLDARVLRRMLSLDRQTDVDSSLEVSLSVADHALSAAPDDPELQLARADILATRKDYEGTSDALEQLITSSRPPLGIEGMMRIIIKTEAAVRQTRYALQAATQAEAGEEARSTWLARAKESRQRLAQLLPESSPAVQLFDAKIALLDGDLVSAQSKLEQYNQTRDNQDAEGLWLAADVAERLNQLGNAQTALNRLIELDPTQSAPHVALASVLASLNRPEEALDHARVALKGRPDDPVLLEQIRKLEIQLGIRQSDDPYESVLVNAQLKALGTESEIADPAGAVAILREGLGALGPDPRLYRFMAQIQLNQGNLEDASSAAAEGLQHFPDDQQLQRFAAASTGSVDDFVRMLEETDQPEATKWLAIYGAYLRADRAEDALRALARAEQADPRSPLVLEVLFTRATGENDLARAREIAERARTVDADRVGGLSYRARLLMLEGKNDEALAALNEAVQRNPNNASMWRLLANLQLTTGRSLDAIQSYRRALAIRPDDLVVINDYCRSLVQLNRLDEALELARRSEVYGRSSPAFMELLLDLEAEVGNKPGARDRREMILAIRPNDISNRLGLIELYISLGQWDKARALIEETREKFGESPAITELDARWYAERNQLENARRVFAAAIAATPPGERIPQYRTLAQFMMRRGQGESALTALRQAARLQPEGDHSVDAYLGDMLMLYNRPTDALRVYKGILASGDDAEYTHTKRAAEAALRAGRPTEAEQLINSVPNADADITCVLLRAEIILNRGDHRNARAMLDGAVRKWPNDHRVWIKRAEAEALSEDLLPDALADVERALELRPGLAEVHRKRAEILAKLGRSQDAINALTEAVRLNPALEELRTALLLEHIKRDNQAEALRLADDWFALHPQDVLLRSRVAETFVQGGMPTAAIQVYQQALAVEKEPQIILRLVDLLLGEQPPRLGAAEQVLSEARTLVPADPSLLLARARVLARTNRAEAARNDCLSSFRLIRSRDAETMTRWYSSLERVFTDPQSLLIFLRELAQQPGGADWASLYSARALLDRPDTATEGLAQLQSVINNTRDPQVRYGGLRRLSGHHYGAGAFEAAITAWNQALEMRPNDWQLENNIAYTLAIDLGRPGDALPYAQAASKHGPDNSETHDTLGAVYLALGRPGDAVAPLEAAVRAARSPEAAAKYKVRLAQARLESGDTQGARDLATEVQAWLDQGRELDDHYAAILQRVQDSLAGG